MSILTDPHLCPECRSTLAADATCPGCGLRLTGPTATRLWHTMQTAAVLVEELRRAPVGAPVAIPVPAPDPRSATGDAPPASPTAGLPTAPPVPEQPRKTLPGSSVPVVLFGVGALCLLVAAVVFVAVAWGSLGLGARTTILLAVTASVAAVADHLTRRGLRGAAETFWLITASMVAIDLAAGYSAGLLGFDDLAPRHATAVSGAVLFGLACVAGLRARRTELRELYGVSAAGVCGLLLVTVTEGWDAPNVAVGIAISVVVLTAVALGLRHIGLLTLAIGSASLAVLSWALLLIDGVERADQATIGAWWRGTEGWPLLAAAAFAAVVAGLVRIPVAVRMVAAGAVQIAVATYVLLPESGPDLKLVLGVGVLVAGSLLAALAPRVAAVPAALLAGTGGVAGVLWALQRPLEVIAELPTTAPHDGHNLGLMLPPAYLDVAPWTAVLVCAGALVAAAALTRWLDESVRGVARRSLVVLAPSILGLGVVTGLIETEPTLVVAVAAWSALLLAVAIPAALMRGGWPTATLVMTGYLAVVGLRLAVPSHLLVAALATALAVGLAVAYIRTSAGPATRAATAVGAVVAAGFAATHWPYLVGGAGDAAGLTLAVLAVGVALTAHLTTRSETDRFAVEITGLVLGLAATAFPTDTAIVTLVLTVVGSAAALTATLHRDREDVAWIGVIVLGGAAALRVSSDLVLPELATAPAAALLITVGVRRLLTDPAASSVRVLGSGLTLALLPTLLLVLDDPVSWRSVALGAAAVLLLAVGIGRRWTAPFLAGAGVLAVLAARHLGPVAEAVPRWISLGLLGAVLLAVAVTWESRRRDLAAAERYLGSLR